MPLFALYENWRPWDERDGYVVGIILVLLFLLVIFNRCKSYLANGAFAGCALGCLCALLSNEVLSRKKMSYVEWGIIVGLLLGWIAKMMCPFLKTPLQEKSEPTISRTQVIPTDDSHSPVFWVSALAISGISVGLTLALVFNMTYQEMVFWIA